MEQQRDATLSQHRKCGEIRHGHLSFSLGLFDTPPSIVVTANHHKVFVSFAWGLGLLSSHTLSPPESPSCRAQRTQQGKPLLPPWLQGLKA